ncbi:unnamed protein product [Prunus armeniaca]|uniref:Uncharacterized protein n=1 Tax=Prunus armeniaca TaxID=36596 RepID=A0A6J5U035_PRUAR|nr:unnamed protein product [Prunus armeniaca]
MAAKMIVSVLLGGLVLLLLYLYESLVLKQKRLRSKLEKQGSEGLLLPHSLGKYPRNEEDGQTRGYEVKGPPSFHCS